MPDDPELGLRVPDPLVRARAGGLLRRRRRPLRPPVVAAVLLLAGCGLLGRSGEERTPPPSEPAAAAERQAPEPARDAIVDFVVGNVEFLLVHEIAHVLIAEKRIPIIGSLENAADFIATLALIREEPLDPGEQDRAVRFLLAAAEAFATSWRVGTALGAEIPYWGSHSLSIQRHYQIACLLFGSDPAAFEHIPALSGLPEDRAQACIEEYARAEESVQWLLDNYGRRPDDPRSAPLPVRYDLPPSLISRRVLRALQSMQLAERVLERLHERFLLERPFQLVLRECGQSEAAWLPSERELVICYELIDALYFLGQRAQ